MVIKSAVPNVKLYDGAEVPSVGLGTWLSKPGEVSKAVETALNVGYRHIDAAHIYGNEHEVGSGWKASGIKRQDFWLTSKLWNNDHRPELVEKALDNTLKNLQTDYLDLYLIHWPVAFKPGSDLIPKDNAGNVLLDDVDYVKTWKELEKAYKAGKVKHIGLSNFSIKGIERILKSAEIKPHVVQIELHPYLTLEKYVEFNKKHNIAITAYSPFGNLNPIYESKIPKLIEDPVVVKVANKHNSTSNQVLVSWAVGLGLISIPKSVHPQRIETNFKLVQLSKDEIHEISSLNKNARFNDPSKSWGVEIFSGFEEE